jgi:hypothetical protein
MNDVNENIVMAWSTRNDSENLLTNIYFQTHVMMYHPSAGFHRCSHCRCHPAFHFFPRKCRVAPMKITADYFAGFSTVIPAEVDPGCLAD